MRVALVLVLTGCGRIGFDPSGSAPLDAPTDTIGNEPGLPRACRMNPAYSTRPGLTSRYREGAASVSWAAARADCMADGADLWIADTNLEAMTLTGDWLGITDVANEGTWITVKGMPATYLPWEVGQPDGGTGENCGRNSDAMFEDRACTDLRDYVCECD